MALQLLYNVPTLGGTVSLCHYLSDFSEDMRNLMLDPDWTPSIFDTLRAEPRTATRYALFRSFIVLSEWDQPAFSSGSSLYVISIFTTCRFNVLFYWLILRLLISLVGR